MVVAHRGEGRAVGEGTRRLTGSVGVRQGREQVEREVPEELPLNREESGARAGKGGGPLDRPHGALHDCVPLHAGEPSCVSGLLAAVLLAVGMLWNDIST